MSYNMYLEIDSSTGIYTEPDPDSGERVGTANPGDVYKVVTNNPNNSSRGAITTEKNGVVYYYYQDANSGYYIFEKAVKLGGNTGTDRVSVLDTTRDNKDDVYNPKTPLAKKSTTNINTKHTQDTSVASDDKLNKSIQNNSTTTNNSSPTTSTGGNTPGATSTVGETTPETSDTYSTEIEEFLGGIDRTYAQAQENLSQIRSSLGVFGLPYQFMPHVDPRVTGAGDSSGIGEMGADYADKILSTMPLLFISPGKPSFMAGYSNDEEKTVLQAMISQRAGASVGIDDLISKNGKFYTFEYDVTGYYSYVNPMCRITAQLLNITDERYSIGDSTNDNLDWRLFTQTSLNSISSLLNDYLAVPFYIDSDTQISESMSNDVTDSSLASTVDSFSDMGRELMFYLGYTPALMNLNSLTDADLLQNTENLQNMVSSIREDNIFKSLINQVSAVATGGRIQFPKIWSDSSFSRSYDVNIKLRSPDMDNLSLWTNIIVPLCHILGFVQPRMITNNPNAYTSPFLIRAMYKGFFNVDMGIISSCNITKGDDAQWSINGIPTTVDVSLTITDLYDAMSITPGNNLSFDTLDNTSQMDYLMNLCGINIYKPEFDRLIDLYLTHHMNSYLGDAVANLFGGLRDTISGSIKNIYRGLL